jgi:hypothetical protein
MFKMEATMDRKRENRMAWMVWFAVSSLPIAILQALGCGFASPLAVGFVLVTTAVAATLGWLAAPMPGGRWWLRTLVGVPLAGAVYGSLVALFVVGPLFFIGTMIGAAASLPYLPFLLLAAAAADGPSSASLCSV